MTDAQLDEFQNLREEVHLLMSGMHATREIKLLNVGTDRSGERHWRFRTPSGQIVTLKMEIES